MAANPILVFFPMPPQWWSGQVAQLVEHWTENPGVAGSIPALSTGCNPLAGGPSRLGGSPRREAWGGKSKWYPGRAGARVVWPNRTSQPEGAPENRSKRASGAKKRFCRALRGALPARRLRRPASRRDFRGNSRCHDHRAFAVTAARIARRPFGERSMRLFAPPAMLLRLKSVRREFAHA